MAPCARRRLWKGRVSPQAMARSMEAVYPTAFSVGTLPNTFTWATVTDPVGNRSPSLTITPPWPHRAAPVQPAIAAPT